MISLCGYEWWPTIVNIFGVLKEVKRGAAQVAPLPCSSPRPPPFSDILDMTNRNAGLYKMIYGVYILCLTYVDSFNMSITYCNEAYVGLLGVLLKQNKEEALAIQQRNRQNEIRRYAVESIMRITRTARNPNRCEKMLVHMGTVPHEPAHVVNIRVRPSPIIHHREASLPPSNRTSRNRVPYHRRPVMHSRGHN